MVQNLDQYFSQFSPVAAQPEEGGFYDIMGNPLSSPVPTSTAIPTTVNTQRLSNDVQVFLGAKRPEQRGVVNDILASRFDTQPEQSVMSMLPMMGGSAPSYQDYLSSAISALHGNFNPATDYAANSFSDQFKRLNELTEMQKSLKTGTGGGATGELVSSLMSERTARGEQNNTFERALYDVQTGYRQGYLMNEAGGIAPRPGFMGALSERKAAEAGGTATGKNIAELQMDAPKRDAAKQYASQKYQEVSASVADTADYVKNNYATGTAATNVRGLPGYTLQSKIDNIISVLGFQELQAMRDSSPTGGALGQVALQELAMLQSTVASLKLGLSDEEKVKSLEKIQNHLDNWYRITTQYQNDLDAMSGGEGGLPEQQPALPPPASDATDYREYFK